MKKRVRIYKAGGQKGQYINPTAKWMMQVGGQPQAQSEISDEQISAYVQNALMQDADPNDIYKSLVQSGVDKNKANQIISSIVEYINEARKVEMSDKTGQPELAQQEAEEIATLERAAAEEDAQRARQMQMMQMAMEDTQADEEMFTNDVIDDYIEGNDEQMMYGGQPLPSKSKFVKQAMKEYKKGGAIGQGQKPDEASLNAATNFIQSVNKESNEAKIKQEAEQYYDNVMLPQARRGKEMRTQRMLNRGLNQILGGVSNAGMASPYMYSQANPYGAQLKTANINVEKTGLFGRPKQYSVQFDWDYINQPQLIEDAIDLEVSNAEDEVKNTQKQQVAKKNETTSANSRLKELAKKRASGEVKSSGTTKSSGTKKATVKTEPEVKSQEKIRVNSKGEVERFDEDTKKWVVSPEFMYQDGMYMLKSEPSVSKGLISNLQGSTSGYGNSLKKLYNTFMSPEFAQNYLEANPQLAYDPYAAVTLEEAGIQPFMGYPGAGVGSVIADLYGWVTGDENVDRQSWDQAVASLIFGRPAPAPKALGQGFTSGKAVYTPPSGATRLPAGTPGFPNVPGTAVPRIGTSGLPKSLPAGPRGYLNPGQRMLNAPDGTQLVIPFKQGGMHNQFGGAVNPFNLDPTGLTKFIYGGSHDLTMYQTAGEKQKEFWTKHYRKPDTGEIINQETGAVVTLPEFTDDVTTQTGTSDYEKRIKELENQLAGFKSNAGVARDMYGRQLPPPLFNRRAKDLAGMGSFLGMAGALNPFEYVGSWNQYSDMYDPNTGEKIPDEVRKRIGLPNLSEIDVRKSRLFGGLPKEYSLKFGMPGSKSMSKEELKSDATMSDDNSFSNIDSKGRLIRPKEDTIYNKMSEKKWEKFKEKEAEKNIPEDYINPETETTLSDLKSIQTVQQAQQQPAQQAQNFDSWLSRNPNAMSPVQNPSLTGLDLLSSEDYPTQLMNTLSNESNSNISRIINNDPAYRSYLSKDIMDTLPEGYSFRESDNTLMFPFSDTEPAPPNPRVRKTVSTDDPISRRMNAGLSIGKLKDEVFPGNPDLRNEMESMVKVYSQENNIPEENFKQYQRLLPEQKLELINKAKDSGKKDLYEILIYLADAGSSSNLNQVQKGGSLPRFQNNGQFNLVDTSAIEVDEDYLMGERPDYVQFYDDKEYMFSGKDDSFIGPAQVDVKEKDTYTFDPRAGLDLFNVGAYKFLQNRERPDMTQFMGTNLYDSNMDVADKGTYDIDSGLFRPGEMGFEGVVQKGGSINDELYMTEEEIEEFLRNGGQLEYL